MKRFYILRNAEKDPLGTISDSIASFLTKNGAAAEILSDGSEADKDLDGMIILGGDGTVLRAARRICRRNIPLIGINLGSLGYLAEVSRSSVFPALEKLLAGEYTVEERMMLEGTVLRKGKVIAEGVALNDVTISRRGPLRIVQFETFINDSPLSAFNADGIILSTPTGSTGYSFSAGGPVVSPSASLLIMTPVASHTINARSIIFADSDRIRVSIGQGRQDNRQKTAAVYFDGEDELMLRRGDCVEVKKSEFTTKIIKLSNISFLETLRHKMQMT